MEPNVTTEIKTVFAPYKDGVYKLHGDPFTKKDWLKKLTDGPFRKAGIVILLLIFVITIIHYREVWKESPPTNWFNWNILGGANVTSYPSVTLTKYSWAEIGTTGKKFRGVSLNPPVRRLVMVDDDPNRIYPLPAGVDNSIDLGISRSLKFKIDPSEEPTFSKFEYELR